MGKRNKKPRIALIGPYPPPYGGISVHIQRMKEHLERVDIEYIIYDTSGTVKNEKNIVCVSNLKRWLPKYFFFAKEDIIHFHSPNWKMRVIISLMGIFGKTVIITSNGDALKKSLEPGNMIKKMLLKYSLKHASLITGTNENIREVILSAGIKPENIKIITSFIPFIEKDEDYQKIPQYIRDFMNGHHPVLSANGWAVLWDDVDLYGIDLLINAIKKLKDEYPNIGLVFKMSGIQTEDYWGELKKNFKDNDLKENILIIHGELSAFYPIITKSDVFVRPTYVDGEGISIKEALYLGVPTITSDACPRPKESIVFKNRDLNDLIKKLQSVLQNNKEYRNKIKNITFENGAIEWIKIYKELAKK